MIELPTPGKRQKYGFFESAVVVLTGFALIHTILFTLTYTIARAIKLALEN